MKTRLVEWSSHVVDNDGGQLIKPTPGIVLEFRTTVSPVESSEGTFWIDTFRGTVNSEGVLVSKNGKAGVPLPVGPWSWTVSMQHNAFSIGYSKTFALIESDESFNLATAISQPVDAEEFEHWRTIIADMEAQATIARTAATDALGYANRTHTDANRSATSAGNAAAAATAAQSSAASVGDAVSSASSFAAAASDSAAAASVSSGVATSRASEASTAAGVAQSRAGDASVSATAAAGSATNAAASAGSALAEANRSKTEASKAAASAASASGVPTTGLIDKSSPMPTGMTVGYGANSVVMVRDGNTVRVWGATNNTIATTIDVFTLTTGFRQNATQWVGGATGVVTADGNVVGSVWIENNVLKYRATAGDTVRRWSINWRTPDTMPTV